MGKDEPFRRILVICTRQLGDVLLTTPLIEAARQRWPEAQLDVLGFAGTLGMLRGNPAIGALVEVEAGSGWGRSMGLIRRLWRRYDLALIAEPSDRAHLLGYIAARLRSGLVPQTKAHAWWKRPLLHHAVIVAGTPDRHIAAEKLALLEPWTRTAPPLLVKPPTATPLPEDLAPAIGAGVVVVHAPSMWRYKQWPISHYARLVQALVEDGRQVVLTGASSDRGMIAPLAAIAGFPKVVDASGRLAFGQLAALLARAALYIGPDTSVTHLAAASGVPVIALFGPTDPTRWGPLGDAATAPPFVRVNDERRQRRGNVLLLQGPGSCVPCGRSGCADRNDSVSECLEAIEPERVLAEARRLLAVAGQGDAPSGRSLIRAPAAGA